MTSLLSCFMAVYERYFVEIITSAEIGFLESL
jgi:hypothetical protein